jgi:hypothetical protein
MSQPQPAPTAPASSPAQGRRSGLDAYYKDWEKRAAAAHATSKAHDWSGVDFSKISSKDVRVEFGPMFTEEQFKQYQAQNQANKNEKKFSPGR